MLCSFSASAAAPGCALWRNGPQPTWSAAPAVQPGGEWSSGTLQPQADPAASPTPSSTTGSVGSPPTGQTQTLARPLTPPAGSTPATAEPTPLTSPRTPSATPTVIQSAPTIPDPNAAVPSSTQLSAGRSTEATHQRVHATSGEPLTWKSVGRSSGGRPIEMLQLGRGTQHLILMGSLFGNERDAVEFVESVTELLHREPQRLADYSLVVIRTPNPDGLAEGTLTNSRGVALNRNFPSSNFFTQRTAETGLLEASEAETQALGIRR